MTEEVPRIDTDSSKQPIYIYIYIYINTVYKYIDIQT